MKIIGIDPGAKGCIVELDSKSQTARYLNIPYRFDGIIAFDIINAQFDYLRHVDHILLEKVGGRCGWGASQTFKFGVNYGQVLGYLWDRPHSLVAPKTWQGLAHAGTTMGSPKDRSRMAFVKLNPAPKVRAKDDGLIDAFHIARWGLRHFRQDFTDHWTFINLEVTPNG